jgi:magnesium chelatase family protein
MRPAEPSVSIRQRVDQARKVQLAGFAGKRMFCNAQMGARELAAYCQVNSAGERLLELAINRLGLSARAYTRILKVARTIADLDGSGTLEAHHIAETIQYRSLDRMGL